jgi:hypothetical protein
MHRLFATASLVALISVSGASACGGGDDGPDGRWSLDHKEYSRVEGLPFLSPGNDSRINLQFLMMDAHPWRVTLPASPADGQPNPDSAISALFARSDLDAAFNAGLAPARGKQEAAGGSSFADGEGSRCLSLESGKQAFAAAVQAATGLSDTERSALIAERNQMAPSCADDNTAKATDSPAPASPLSAPAQGFETYLTGAKAFYAGAFDQALTQFGMLAKMDEAWLRESARYMVGRTLLNKAQIGAFAALDGVAEPKVTDQASLTASETELKAYLDAYPKGRYAASARGLLRRVYWLADDKAKLAAEYGWQIAHVTDAAANLTSSDLAQEIDSKYLGGVANETHDPNLLAVQDLMKLRGQASAKAKFTTADLEAQAPDFSGHEALFAFLKAARAYYADGDNAATLQLLGPAQPGSLSPPYLAFSREVLRGQALMAAGQYDAAIDHWKRIEPLASLPWQSEAVELGLAASWERAGTMNKVFLPETRIASPRIRTILLRYAAGPILLRQAVDDPQSTPSERATARFVLLFKEATRGHYTGFLRDYVPADLGKDEPKPSGEEGNKLTAFNWVGAKEPYQCPALKAVMSELAANAKSSHGLLCLTEFTRTTGLDAYDSGYPKPDELGGGKSIFPGEPFSRGETYKKLIADASTPDHDRAYALYRAVNCYRPAGINECGGKDVDVAQRKAWYNMLKSRYGATSWARSLGYYW